MLLSIHLLLSLLCLLKLLEYYHHNQWQPNQRKENPNAEILPRNQFGKSTSGHASKPSASVMADIKRKTKQPRSKWSFTTNQHTEHDRDTCLWSYCHQWKTGRPTLLAVYPGSICRKQWRRWRGLLKDAYFEVSRGYRTLWLQWHYLFFIWCAPRY